MANRFRFFSCVRMGFQVLIPCLLLVSPCAQGRSKSGSRSSKGVKTIRLDDRHIATIRVNKNGTVINFPVKPKRVILGRKHSFDIEYIANDVALAALSSSSSSNLFVYLHGRRYAFRLYTAKQGGDEVVLVRDPKDLQIQVEVRK